MVLYDTESIPHAVSVSRFPSLSFAHSSSSGAKACVKNSSGVLSTVWVGIDTNGYRYASHESQSALAFLQVGSSNGGIPAIAGQQKL
jgi:hypothetical protein